MSKIKLIWVGLLFIFSDPSFAGKNASRQYDYLVRKCQGVPDLVLRIKIKLDRIGFIREKLEESKQAMDRLPSSCNESNLIKPLLTSITDHWSQYEKIRHEILRSYENLERSCDAWITFLPDQLEKLFRDNDGEVLDRLRKIEGMKDAFIASVNAPAKDPKEASSLSFLLRQAHLNFQNWDASRTNYEKNLKEWSQYWLRDANAALKKAEYFQKQLSSQLKQMIQNVPASSSEASTV